MLNLTIFAERLSERMNELNLSSETLAKRIAVNISTINDWKRGKFLIVLSNLLKLADSLECSMDFLAGRTETILDFTPKACPPFYPHLCTILEKRNTTKYKLYKEKVVSRNTFDHWKNGIDPHIVTLCRLADYLDISIDYLVGRDR